MRRFIVHSFITLDGIMQAPGAPQEDPSNGFKFGGWTAPYNDEESGNFMQKLLEPADLLLGRKTFDIWENYWPKHGAVWPGINEVKKYVLSRTRNQSSWNNSTFIKSIDDIRLIKSSEGTDIKIWGSSEVVQLLCEHELIDEFWLMIHPVLLGKGKRLFNDRSIPAAFHLAEKFISPKGVIMANYKKMGQVETGNVGE